MKECSMWRWALTGDGVPYHCMGKQKNGHSVSSNEGISIVQILPIALITDNNVSHSYHADIDEIVIKLNLDRAFYYNPFNKPK